MAPLQSLLCCITGRTTRTEDKTCEERVDTAAYSMSRRPSFKQWLRVSFVDILTLAVLGGLSLGIYHFRTVTYRSFPIPFDAAPFNSSAGAPAMSRIYFGLEQLSQHFASLEDHRPLDRLMPSFAAYLLGGLLIFLVALVLQVRIWSFWDLNTAFYGLRSALVSASLCQVMLKWLVGGLRPFLLDVCEPNRQFGADRNETGLEGVGFDGMFYTRNSCGNDWNEQFESFPSGHSTAVFATAVFTFLYLNAKLKVFANYHPAMWKLLVLYLPVVGAMLISTSLVSDGSHQVGDVVAGAVIGTVFAFASYRIAYASIWDWRYNHIPLHGERPFEYESPEEGDGWMDGWEMVATREAGWGEMKERKRIEMEKAQRALRLEAEQRRREVQRRCEETKRAEEARRRESAALEGRDDGNDGVVDPVPSPSDGFSSGGDTAVGSDAV